MRYPFPLSAILLLAAACSPRSESTPLVPLAPFLVQLDHHPGRSDSVAAVTAGADSVTIIPLASAMVLKAAGTSSAFQALAGFAFTMRLGSTAQSGQVTVTFASPATPADVALLRSLPIDTLVMTFNADSTSVVIGISYRALNLFAGDANATAAVIEPFYRPDDLAMPRR